MSEVSNFPLYPYRKQNHQQQNQLLTTCIQSKKLPKTDK